MTSGMRESQKKKLILKAISYADKVAGKDDVRFVQVLRANFFAEQGRRVWTRVSSMRRGPMGEPGLQIFRDPRFVRNARELARRTLGGMRIIGGTTVMKDEFTDCVAIGDDQDWGCSGTLIAPNAVFTAGHCAESASRIFLGSDVSK